MAYHLAVFGQVTGDEHQCRLFSEEGINDGGKYLCALFQQLPVIGDIRVIGLSASGDNQFWSHDMRIRNERDVLSVCCECCGGHQQHREEDVFHIVGIWI